MIKSFVANGAIYEIDDRRDMEHDLSDEIENYFIDKIMEFSRLTSDHTQEAFQNLVDLVTADYRENRYDKLSTLQECINDNADKVAALAFVDDVQDIYNYLVIAVQDGYQYQIYSIPCFECNERVPRFEFDPYEEEEDEERYFIHEYDD